MAGNQRLDRKIWVRGGVVVTGREKVPKKAIGQDNAWEKRQLGESVGN